MTLSDALVQFEDELGGPMTVQEFCEITGWALNDIDPATRGGVVVPVLEPGAEPSSAPSRVSTLNDAVFVDVADFLAQLARDRANAGTSPTDLITAVLDDLALALRDCEPDLLADVPPDAVVRLELRRKTPRRITISVGDVVGIPVGADRYFLAVVVAKNRFGTAYGLLGVTPRVPEPDIPTPVGPTRIVYADDSCVVEGSWPVVGKIQAGLEHFPAEPEIFHAPMPDFPDLELGEFGAAESPSGDLRLLSRSEAESVGLLDGSYEQAVHCTELQQHLAADG